MLRIDDASAVAAIRRYFDEVSYCYVNYRLIPGHDSIIFPEFAYLHNVLKGLNGIYRLLFTLFRQGHAADKAVLQQILSPEVLEAMVATGLLVQNARGQWRTPGLAIVPIEGLYLAVSLPPYYPTATTRKQPVYLGTESIWLTKALPAQLTGCRVLDICAGSGIQGLICAQRGASCVVLLEKAGVAVAVARFNAALNGLSEIVEIRESDLFSALREDEMFDFVVSNPPFMPVMEDVDYPLCGSGGADGTVLLRGIFEGLPAHLCEDAKGVVFCNALGDQYSINFNREVLLPLTQNHGLFIRAYVTEKFPISQYISTLEGNLRNTCPELSAEDRKVKIAVWLEELRRQGVAADYIYGQIIRFGKGRVADLANLPVYNPYLTDPLVTKIVLAKAWA